MDAEQGQVNLGIMAGERRAALAKVAELTEQKRVLVREPAETTCLSEKISRVGVFTDTAPT